MNRKDINKVLDNLQIIEDFGKRYKPDYEIELNNHIYNGGDTSPGFDNFNISYSGTSIILYFSGHVDGPYWSLWGTASLKCDVCDLIDFSKEDNDTKDYLKLLNFIVDKINKDELKIDLK